MLFLPFICLFAGDIFFWRFWVLAVLWLGGLFYGGMSLFYAVVCALCAWVSLVYFFYLSFYSCLAVAGFAFVVCAAVSALCPVVFYGGLRFPTFLC